MMFLRLLKPFTLGVKEAGLSTGITYDGDPEAPRSRAYDRGRNFGDHCREIAHQTAGLLNTKHGDGSGSEPKCGEA